MIIFVILNYILNYINYFIDMFCKIHPAAFNTCVVVTDVPVSGEGLLRVLY